MDNLTKVLTIEPPQIVQHFDKDLLSRPCAKFYDDEETLWKIYLKIKNKIKGHAITLEKEFLEIYERIKKKKENADPKAKNKTKEFFYRIKISDHRSEPIFAGLTCGAGFMCSFYYRKKHALRTPYKTRIKT